MTAVIHHEARLDHLERIFAERRRIGLPSRGIEARSGETGTGSIRQDESPSRRARHTTGGPPNAR